MGKPGREDTGLGTPGREDTEQRTQNRGTGDTKKRGHRTEDTDKETTGIETLDMTQEPFYPLGLVYFHLQFLPYSLYWCKLILQISKLLSVYLYYYYYNDPYLTISYVITFFH